MHNGLIYCFILQIPSETSIPTMPQPSIAGSPRQDFSKLALHFLYNINAMVQQEMFLKSLAECE